MAGLTGSSGNLNVATVAIVANHAYTPNSSVTPQGYSKVSPADLNLRTGVPGGIGLEIWKSDATKSIQIGIRGSLDSADFAKDSQILNGNTPQAAIDAAAFVQELAQKYSDFAVTLTGHSFGGYVSNFSQVKAQDAGLQNVAAVAFDPLGIASNELASSSGSYNVVNFYSRVDPAYNASTIKGLLHPGKSVAIDFVGPDAESVASSIKALSQSMAALQDPSLGQNASSYLSVAMSAYKVASGMNAAHSSTAMTDRMVDLGRKGFTVNQLGDPDITPLTPGVVGPDLAQLIRQENPQTQTFVNGLATNASKGVAFFSSLLDVKETFLNRMAQVGEYTYELDGLGRLTLRPAQPDPELIKGLSEYNISVDATNKLIEDHLLRSDNSAVARNYEYSPIDQTATKTTTKIFQDAQLISEEQDFPTSKLLKFYNTQNYHPYDKLEVTKDPNGQITAAQLQLEANIIAAGGSVGQIFGSALGRALAPNNPVHADRWQHGRRPDRPEAAPDLYGVVDRSMPAASSPAISPASLGWTSPMPASARFPRS